MGQYPEKAEDFKEKIAELALNAALKENTVEGFQKYIDEFADFSKSSKYTDEAKNALKIIYFNEAKEKKSIVLLEEFINTYKTEDAVLSEQAASIIDDINREAQKKIDEFDWNIALEKSKTEDIILPLKEYVDSHPDSAYRPEAEKLIKQMQDDSSYSEKYFEEPTLDMLDEFILNYPGHKDTAKALELRKDFIGDIYSLGQKEYLAAVGVGDSITRTRIIVENRTESKLIVTLPFGMYFAANSGYIQNMIIREEKTLVIEAGRKKSIYINTACMNIYRDIPNEDSYFGITMLNDDSPLIPLLRVLAFNNASFAVAQAAVWQITDNPGKDIILGTLEYKENGTNAITEDDYNEALRLIDMALNK
jgi:outer membrane protein assembly factor BamD (BamD/ComL family)